MGVLTIRDIPDEVMDRLSQRASEAGLSVEDYVSQLVEREIFQSSLPAEAKREGTVELRAIRALSKPWKPGMPTGEDIIREERDRR